MFKCAAVKERKAYNKGRVLARVQQVAGRSKPGCCEELVHVAEWLALADVPGEQHGD